MPSVFAQQLGEELSALHVGQRAWFWCCPAHTDAPLLLSRLQSDPRMDQLRKQTEGLRVSRFAPRAVGLAHVAENGAIQLGGAGFSSAMLPAIASWAADNVDATPALARLRGLRAVRLDEAGTVVERFSSAALWAGLPEQAAPGTIADAAQRLARLKPGQQGWFWMVERGPFLALGSQRRDPDGAAFSQSAQVMLRRFPKPGRQLTGLLRAEEGGLFFTSAASVADGHAILGALFRKHPALRPSLLGARVVQLDGGRSVAASAPLEDLRDTVALLGGLSDGAELRFISAPGAPLLVSESAEALKAAAVARGVTSGVRGRLVASGRGWLHFTTRQPADGLIERIAAWHNKHRSGWPGLSALAGARASHVGGDRSPLQRYRNDDAWEVVGA